MPSALTLIGFNVSITWPNHLIGWLGWLAFLGMIIWALIERWEPVSGAQIRRSWRWMLVLTVAVPLTSLLLWISLPVDATQLSPDILVEPTQPVLTFFAALPWVLAAGFLGPAAAVLLAVFSGILLMLNNTHSPFTPLELAAAALMFSLIIRQRFRTRFYAIARHPLAAALLVGLAYLPMLVLSAFFSTNGDAAARMDYALTQTWPLIAARVLELLLAGLVAEGVLLAWPSTWGAQGALRPSPSEASLEKRFLFGTLPLLVVLFLSLMIGDWVVAGNAASQMIESQLKNTAETAAESLPYFLETGQNLILHQARPELLEIAPAERQPQLASLLRAVPYFRQLVLFDASGEALEGYPEKNFENVRPTQDEQVGVKIALKGVMIQTYVTPPLPQEESAQISFIAAIKGADGQIEGVLLGRTDLSNNPFTRPTIQMLQSMQKEGGVGMILDENRRILYHPSPSLIMENYTGRLPEDASFFEDADPAGRRLKVYYQMVKGRPWSVVLTMPAQRAQSISLEIAWPLLTILALGSLLTLLYTRFNLRRVTASLQTLSVESMHIAQGKLDRSLQASGVDEVGRLSSAFERMRMSLKARLDELNRLLVVSQGVASNLEIEDAVRPILQAALGDGASLSRLVLVREVTLDPGERPQIAFGAGQSGGAHAYLDSQIFDMMRHQEILSIPNTSRVRRLNFAAGGPSVGALLALALHHESNYYGAFWIGYDQPHNFSDEEVRFLSTLAGQAALAAANARLYASAEVGRQRLEAVLASTPEPVLVIDDQDRLLLLNPAAIQAAGLISSAMPGRPIQDVIAMPALLDLVRSPGAERVVTREITLPNGRIYYASVSPVIAAGKLVGKVCLLRDITHYKELDALKSEFVSTVSHDMRSPLTLIRGYATMLPMVGELNEQQTVYSRKIVTGVENLTRLVNNLLDLGRIEAGIGLQLETVLVTDIIDRAASGLSPQAAQKNIQFSQELSGIRDLQIRVDSALMEHAVSNLIENAIKYTPLGGQVQVLARKMASSVVVEVRDTGIGIAPIDLPRLFEKFYRSGRKEAYQQRGTGLGLAIVKSIAERHGGRVWVESRLGKGSTFYLEVPFEQPKAA